MGTLIRRFIRVVLWLLLVSLISSSIFGRFIFTIRGIIIIVIITVSSITTRLEVGGVLCFDSTDETTCLRVELRQTTMRSYDKNTEDIQETRKGWTNPSRDRNIRRSIDTKREKIHANWNSHTHRQAVHPEWRACVVCWPLEARRRLERQAKMEMRRRWVMYLLIEWRWWFAEFEDRRRSTIVENIESVDLKCLNEVIKVDLVCECEETYLDDDDRIERRENEQVETDLHHMIRERRSSHSQNHQDHRSTRRRLWSEMVCGL